MSDRLTESSIWKVETIYILSDRLTDNGRWGLHDV